MLMLFGGVTVVQAIVVAIVSAVLAIRARREAQAKPDERDRAIARRGASAAYFVLMVGMILVGVVMPFGDPRWKITNARSEEHMSELQSLMRISYAVFCLKKKNQKKHQ